MNFIATCIQYGKKLFIDVIINDNHRFLFATAEVYTSVWTPGNIFQLLVIYNELMAMGVIAIMFKELW